MPKFKGYASEATSVMQEQSMERNIASLLGAKRTQTVDLPISRIRPNPFQARRTFSDIEELARSISVQGFTSRLRVRPDPTDSGWFQLVFGERRLRAAALAGLTELPCEIADHSDDEMIEIGLAENIQRRDLDPLEEAQAFRTFIDQRGYSIRSLGDRIGKDKSYIEERLALLRTPRDVQTMIEQRPDTIRVAREIAKLPTAEDRAPLIRGVVQGSLSSREVRSQVRDRVTPSPDRKGPDAPPSSLPRASVTTLDEEIGMVRILFTRWNAEAATFSTAERKTIAAYLAEHVNQLRQLHATLKGE